MPELFACLYPIQKSILYSNTPWILHLYQLSHKIHSFRLHFMTRSAPFTAIKTLIFCQIKCTLSLSQNEFLAEF